MFVGVQKTRGFQTSEVPLCVRVPARDRAAFSDARLLDVHRSLLYIPYLIIIKKETTHYI